MSRSIESEHSVDPGVEVASSNLQSAGITSKDDIFTEEIIRKRELLGSFLRAINQRSGTAASALFEANQEVTWETNDKTFGRITGRDAICHFVENVLPKVGPEHILTENGLHVQVMTKVFEFKLEMGSHGLIQHLERVLL